MASTIAFKNNNGYDDNECKEDNTNDIVVDVKQAIAKVKFVNLSFIDILPSGGAPPKIWYGFHVAHHKKNGY